MHRQIWAGFLTIALTGCAGGLAGGGGLDGGSAGTGGALDDARVPDPLPPDRGPRLPIPDQGLGGEGGMAGGGGAGGEAGVGGAADMGGRGGAGGQGGMGGMGGLAGAGGVPGQRRAGQTCISIDDCATDACLDFNTGAGRICVEFCSNGRCPDGFFCHPSSYCVPDGGAGGMGGGGGMAGMAGAGGEVVPELGCGELSNCIDDCGNDFACAAECQMQSPAEAQMAYNAWTTCAEENGCSLANRACLLFDCATETDACLGPRPGADLDCEALNTCLTDCADNACQTACVEQATTDALIIFDAVDDCIDREMCVGNGACQRARCGADLQMCFPDAAYPQGNENCAQFNDCLGTCGQNDQPCVDNCVRRASPDGYLRFFDVLECADRTGCIQAGNCPNACPNEWNACFP